MHSLRRGWIVVLAGCFLISRPLVAQQTPVPGAFANEFSADTIFTDGKGLNLAQKIFGSNGKIRSQGSGDMPMTVIIRPDQKKVYSIMDPQKMVMVMPFDPGKMSEEMVLATGLNGKYDTIGPAIVDGVACTEYRYVSDQHKVFDLWVDTAQKVPVKMAAEDQSFTLLIKNYHAGPQDPSLFEPPADYQVMTMPSLPNMPSAPVGQP